MSEYPQCGAAENNEAANKKIKKREREKTNEKMKKIKMKRREKRERVKM